MKIVIVGGGKVGYTLAAALSAENHDITIIDNNEDALSRASDTLDVMCIKGNGASVTALAEAGAADADVLMAVTSRDEINMLCCLLGKRLGTAFTIARIRDVEYSRELDVLKQGVGLDMVINPELATAVEVSRLVRFPSADNIETFCRGRVELVGFRTQKGDFLSGQPLSALTRQLQNLPVLICAVERGEQFFIPNGSFVIEQGDMVYIIGELYGVAAFFRILGRLTPKAKTVLMVGGGRIAHYLSEILDKLGMKVKIIEKDEERCLHLSEELPKALVLCGDGTDQELLDVENLHGVDVFLAITGHDEENLITALYARQCGVPKVIAKANRQNYAGVARAVGIDSIISPKLITANEILRVVRGMESSEGSVMSTLYRIAGGRAEATEFVAGPSTRNLGVPLKKLRLKPGILLAVIAHGNALTIPEGNSVLSSGDSVIVIAEGGAIRDLNDIYAEGQA